VLQRQPRRDGPPRRLPVEQLPVDAELADVPPDVHDDLYVAGQLQRIRLEQHLGEVPQQADAVVVDQVHGQPHDLDEHLPVVLRLARGPRYLDHVPEDIAHVRDAVPGLEVVDRRVQRP